MKMFIISFFVAISIASVQAAPLPITKMGCQCISECKKCPSYYTVLTCKDWLNTPICKVNSKTCDDYTYKKDSANPMDQCGSWKDGITSLLAKMKSWFKKSAASIKHLSGKVADWADEYVLAIDVSDLAKTDKDLLPKLAAVWGKFNDKQLADLKAAGKDGWDKMIAKIPPEDLAALDKAVQEKLDVGKKIGERLKSITLEDVATWTDKMWDKVPIDNLVFFVWSALQKIPLAELGKWTKEQWVKIPVDKLVRFTGAQIAKIDSAGAAALADKYWDYVPVYHVTRFSVGLIQSAGLLKKLNRTKLAYLTAKQWQAFPVESILKFTLDQLQAINYTALGAWSKDVWDKVPIAQVAAFVDRQIAAVPPAVVGNWTMEQWLKFPTKEVIMFTGKQLIAGANALKDLTVEQLSKYDWSQIGDDAFAKLPLGLQKKITELRKYATSFNATQFKARVVAASEAKGAKVAALKKLQETKDNPKATADVKKKAEIEYKAAVATEDTLEREVEVERMAMYALPPKAKVASTAGARTTASAATVLLTVMWLQG